MRTLSGLVAYDGQMGNTGGDDKEMLATSDRTDLRPLADKWVVVTSWQEAMQRVHQGGYAFLNSMISTKNYMEEQQEDKG